MQIVGPDQVTMSRSTWRVEYSKWHASFTSQKILKSNPQSLRTACSKHSEKSKGDEGENTLVSGGEVDKEHAIVSAPLS